MKFSEAWLRTWTNPNVTTEELEHQLSNSGLEVAAIEPVGGDFINIVVAKILDTSPHPNADSLTICKVDAGESEQIDIVTAAQVHPGMRVPLAKVGARLADGTKIKKAKLRGEPSFGMFCSSKELAVDHEFFELPDDAPVGQDLKDYLDLNDKTIDIELTPNRGDCLSIAGIANEVGVLNNCEVNSVDIKAVEPKIDDTIVIDIEAPADCPRYIARIIKNIKLNQAVTPSWIKNRLSRSGVNTISPVVDIVNYVMLELGQPMHAFDLSKISDKIVVRKAKTEESLKLLDENEVTFNSNTLLIADSEKPLAMAGMMGGLDSAVSDKTQDILLESAYFNPSTITQSVQYYQIHTDSSHRFERYIDHTIQQKAIERVTELLLEVVGGEPGPICEAVSEEHLPQTNTILLRQERVARILGFTIKPGTIENILTRLGFTLTVEGDSAWQVQAPTHRADIHGEIDLIEEIVRIYGYNNIPESIESHIQLTDSVNQPAHHHLQADIAKYMALRDYQEAITFSFVDPKSQAVIHPEQETLALANPISADLSEMRLSLWPGLLKAAQHNLNRQQARVRLFEIGMRFVPENSGLKQDYVLGALVSGDRVNEQWSADKNKHDFYDIKNDVEHLFAYLNIPGQLSFAPGSNPALHGGQCAQIMLGNKAVGWLGVLHPALKAKLGLKSDVILLELTLAEMAGQEVVQSVSPSKFPTIRRDIAIIIDDKIPAETLKTFCIQSSGGLLQDVIIFDVYKGSGIDDDKKSIALGFTLGHQSRTLGDDEVDEVINSVIHGLKKEYNAILRS